MNRDKKGFNKNWIFWLVTFLLPPVALIILFLDKKIINSLRFTYMGLIAFWCLILVIALTSEKSLFQVHSSFVTSLNTSLEYADSDFEIEIIQEDKQSIVSKFNDDIQLIENIDENGRIHELLLIGDGEVGDLLLVMSLLIDSVSQFEDKKQVGYIMSELGLFDSNDFKNKEMNFVHESINYNLKFSEELGLVFSISNAEKNN